MRKIWNLADELLRCFLNVRRLSLGEKQLAEARRSVNRILMNTIDASRFLAQSQSRISFRRPDESPRNPLERPRRQDQSSTSRQPTGRSYFQRPVGINPYHGVATHLSQFPFASRSNAPPAPLFYSATDEFREEDDEEEHEREVADFYALQRSRRQFVESRLEESSEADDDGSRVSGLETSGDGRDSDERGLGRGGGIKSSWKGGKISGRIRRNTVTMMENLEENHVERLSSEGSSAGKGTMYDVGLESTMKSGIEEFDRDEPPADLAIEIPEDNPPSVQNFRKPPRAADPFSPFVPQETDTDVRDGRPAPPDSEASDVPPTVSFTTMQPPRHDVFWSTLYMITLASLFASFLLVYLHTSTPSLKHPLGDTVYTTMQASFHLLAVDTLVAVIVSLCWLALLRSYVRPLVYLILAAVPTILFSFSLYPLVSSYSGPWQGASIQDRIMRYLSPIPGFVALGWVYGIYQGRHSFGKAIGILEFSCRILAANPALLLLGFGTLGGVVAWTWLWMGMFTRVFLGGHLSSAKNFFIIDFSTWWLGVFFVLVYLWTLAVGSGIQRATTAATVSQWYFHRLAVPAPTSRQVVQAALSHSTNTLFGTICLSTLLGLLIRLPLLVLPHRLIAFAGLCTYTLLPNSMVLLTHPTTLTYAAIHSQPLVPSSRAVSQLSIMNTSNLATAKRFPSGNTVLATSIRPHYLAVLLLHATRLVTSFAFGFGAWVSTSRSLALNHSSSTMRGSLYGYVVGLIAGAIGWAILGAMEGVLTGVVDAVVVCWASEVRNGGVKYCREAGWLLGEEQVGGGEREVERGRWREGGGEREVERGRV